MIVAPFRPTTLAKNAQTLVSRVNSRTCDSFIGPRKALENPKYLTKTYFYQPFAAREHRQIGSWFCETESCEGNNLSGIGPHFPQDSRPLRFKKTKHPNRITGWKCPQTTTEIPAGVSASNGRPRWPADRMLGTKLLAKSKKAAIELRANRGPLPREKRQLTRSDACHGCATKFRRSP